MELPLFLVFLALKSVGCGRRISIVNLVTVAWAGHSRVWILAGIRDYCCCQCVRNNFGAHPVYFSVGIGFFLGGSRMGVWNWLLGFI